MKRAPLVLTGTACGLVAVVGYHTAVPQASALTSSASKTGSATIDIGSSSASASSASAASDSSAAAKTKTKRSSSASTGGTRSALGSDVQYQYGDIELKVTISGSRITDISIAREDITDPHSQQIDSYALPELRSQALAAQSARIDGVSGASYTSAAYEQSLQSALDKLKA